MKYKNVFAFYIQHCVTYSIFAFLNTKHLVWTHWTVYEFRTKVFCSGPWKLKADSWELSTGLAIPFNYKMSLSCVILNNKTKNQQQPAQRHKTQARLIKISNSIVSVQSSIVHNTQCLYLICIKSVSGKCIRFPNDKTNNFTSTCNIQLYNVHTSYICMSGICRSRTSMHKISPKREWYFSLSSTEWYDVYLQYSWTCRKLRIVFKFHDIFVNAKCTWAMKTETEY